MRRFWIFRGLKFAFFAVVFVLLGGYVIMHLWNWLIPSIFTGSINPINFWQALGILVLTRILVGGFGRRGGYGGYGGRCGGGYYGHHNWKQRMEQRMANMTPEEREQFKLRMKERWGGRCGNWDKEEEKKETV